MSSQPCLKADGWRVPITNYLKNPSLNIDIKVKTWAMHYFLVNQKWADESVLKCPIKVKA